MIAASDQDTLAGDEPVIVDQNIGNPVGAVHYVAVGPDVVAEDQRGRVGVSGRDLLVDKFNCDIEARRVGGKFGQDGIIHLRPQFGAGHVVPDKTIHVRRGFCHDASAFLRCVPALKSSTGRASNQLFYGSVK